MENPKLCLKFWIRGKRPDEEKGIEVSEASLLERCGFLDSKYQNQPTSKNELFTEYTLNTGLLRLVRFSLGADQRPGYLIEIIGTEEGIVELTGKSDLPYSKQELTKYRK